MITLLPMMARKSICATKYSVFIATLLLFIIQSVQTVKATPPGKNNSSCFRSVLYPEWRQAKHLYDEGRYAEAAELIKTSLKKLAERNESWEYYVNCGSMSIFDNYDPHNYAQLQEGAKFVRAILGRNHRELINWFYRYQNVTEDPSAAQIRAEVEPLLKREVSILERAVRANHSEPVPEIAITLMRIEEEYFEELAAVLKKEGKISEYWDITERQAVFRDEWNLEKYKSIPASESWEKIADQYNSRGLYKKAEPIYRMMLVRVCTFSSTSNMSKVLPPPPLEQILVAVGEGKYQYGPVMYLDKLKETYIKENRLNEAEKCIRCKLAFMSTFYEAHSPAMKLVNQELQQILSKRANGHQPDVDSPR